ncbi:insulin-induced gene 2 protein [Clonorchis sinensis]|uniref:Insulin-induced gene 2 protein n=1 Tax=Clonorchis sinensis TaxID=79923 RepID=G7YNV0_CLOSI|nr:insulin-induced gene 2 protein [Clonorchis sinensis]
MDFKIGAHDVYNKEWSSVFRCVALFFGLSHATARIDFASYAQLVIIIGGLSFGLWWIFDRTRVGLCCGMVAAIIATLLGHAFIRRRLLSCLDTLSFLLWWSDSCSYRTATSKAGCLGTVQEKDRITVVAHTIIRRSVYSVHFHSFLRVYWPSPDSIIL